MGHRNHMDRLCVFQDSITSMPHARASHHGLLDELAKSLICTLRSLFHCTLVLSRNTEMTQCHMWPAFPRSPSPPSARLIALSHGPDDGEEDAPGAYQARGLGKQVLRRLRKSEPPMGLR